MKFALCFTALVCSASTALAVDDNVRTLREVQNEVHSQLKFLPEQDGKDNWQLPTKGYGDCEDYALTKRESLLVKGWSADDVKIILVHNREIGGHAALWIPSLNIVLDSPTDAKRKQILPQDRDSWLKTNGYRFVCVFGDISLGDKKAPVSRRCEPK